MLPSLNPPAFNITTPLSTAVVRSFSKVLKYTLNDLPVFIDP